MSDDATNIPVVLVAQAWDRGYDAGRHDLTHEANPYSVATREWVAWRMGFAQGQTKRLKIIDGDKPCD
jgi:hypothetical protein